MILKNSEINYVNSYKTYKRLKLKGKIANNAAL